MAKKHRPRRRSGTAPPKHTGGRLLAVGAVVVAIAVALVVTSRGSPSSRRVSREIPGVEQPRDAGHAHLAPGAPHDYHDPAPTSGPHDPEPPECGAYAQPLPLTKAVHALEHGVVVLWYAADRPDLRTPLVELMHRYRSHVIVSPNPQLRDPVVATAWDRRMRFAGADDPMLRRFLDTYRRHGREAVACPIVEQPQA